MNHTASPSIGQLPSDSAGPPSSVLAAAQFAQSKSLSNGDFFEAQEELSIANRKKRLPRGVKAARRSLLATKTVVASLQALDHAKWAHRVGQCSEQHWTVGCPNGHGGTVVSAMTQRCGLACCPTCTRIGSRRLSRALAEEMPKIPLQSKEGHRYIWRFLTISLRPRATFREAWEDIISVRSRLFKWLKGIHGGVHPAAICAIEFGEKGHPHLHVLYCGKFIVRDTLSRLLVQWTGGTVVDLGTDEWVAQGQPTKRGRQRYRTWEAKGGDWYVDVREVKGGLHAGIAEVAKYLADPFGGGGDVTVPAEAQKVVAASRNAAAIAFAGKNRHRIEGYGPLRGIVGRVLGKKGRKDPVAEAHAVADGHVPRVRFCPHCGDELVCVRRLDKDAFVWFNRNNPVLSKAAEPPS